MATSLPSTINTNTVEDLTPCVYGQDFGSHASEGTLAYKHAIAGINTIVRVALFGDGDHPERVDRKAGASQFMFFAYAALVDGGLIVGRRALGHDICIPLKTMLVYASGIRGRNMLARLPGGEELLDAVEKGTITFNMMEDALLVHFRELQRNVMVQADEKELVIDNIVLSYPHYLLHKGSQEDMEHYLTYYTGLMRLVWGRDLRYNTVKEGFALALYLSEPFEDGTSFLSRKALSRLYNKVDRTLGLNLVIIDMGGSSMNIQSISLYFDADGKFVCSQSNDNPDWCEGIQGGSDLTNSQIKGVAKEMFQSHVSPGELAAILNDFEQQKYDIDFALDSSSNTIMLKGIQKRFIRLQGESPDNRVQIPAHTVQRIFKSVFVKGWKVWNEEIKLQLDIGRPFVALFCGGSFAGPGLRNQAMRDMEKYKSLAEERGTSFEYAFLESYDRQSASAVASGAAISMLRVPPARSVISGSAVLIQRQSRSTYNSDVWIGSSQADVLFHKGDAGRVRELDYFNIPHMALRRRFSLLCDPNYHKSVQGNGAAPDVVPIGHGSVVWNGAMATYDLGFDVMAQDLPPGNIRFTIEGRYLDELARVGVEAMEDPIKLRLTCHKLNRKGGEVVPDPCSKRWIFTLRTHPEAKLLDVDEVKRCPVWCSICDKEITLAGYVCQDCSTNTDMCVDCYFPADSHWNEELQRPHEVCLVDMDV